MVTIACVQGRLSSPVGTKYQHFPVHAWKEEFPLAHRIGFDGIEWIISDYSNPILDSDNLGVIEQLSKSHQIKVSSMSIDVLMYDPIFASSWGDVSWLFDRISKAVARLGINRISIPVEEKSTINNQSQRELLISAIKRIFKEFGDRIPLISIETDLSPHNVRNLLDTKGLEELGIVVDLGNIAANGHPLREFIDLCGNRIYAFHVKDRDKLYGLSCPLGEGYAEIQFALESILTLPNLSDVTLQAFRTPEDYIHNSESAYRYVLNILKSTDAGKKHGS